MKAPFTIIEVRELPFNIDRNISVSEDVKSHLKLSFLFVLQHQKESDVIALHSVVRCHYDNKILMQGGVTFILKVDGWQSLSHEENDVKSYDWVKDMVQYGFAYVSGMQFKYSAATQLNNLFLPYIDKDELASMLKVEQV